jgi:hypothetical protein
MKKKHPHGGPAPLSGQTDARFHKLVDRIEKLEEKVVALKSALVHCQAMTCDATLRAIPVRGTSA